MCGAILNAEWKITEVVSGCAIGVDRLGESWAEYCNVPVKLFPAQWRDRDGVYDNSAGYKRNVEMAQYADALIAIWDGKSRGTKHMIDIATKRGLRVYIHRV